jgi:pyruvate dehydrogenase E2 component (dihydrolipoamide acetyltransferase)
MQEGTITFWHVSEGDTFDTGDLIYEVETEKSSLGVEAKFDGVLARILVPAGTGSPVPVGTVLALCWDIGEAQDPEVLEQAMADLQREAVQETAPAPGEPVQGKGAPAGVAARPKRAMAQPRARRLAAELGIEIADVQGTGPGGLITEGDVEDAARAKAGPAYRVIEQTAIQKAMTRAMEQSWREIPQFVQTMRFDASQLLATHATLKESERPVGFTSLVLYLASRVIPEHPLVNAEYRADGMVAYTDVNVAVAIDTPRGLVAPVVQGCQALGLSDIDEAIRGLAERAQANRLVPNDSAGGTITLSNLGMFGVEWGTPLINPPHSAIIFIGAPRERLILADDKVVSVPEIALSIAYDHRVVDGATGARFTVALHDALSAPGQLLRM